MPGLCASDHERNNKNRILDQEPVISPGDLHREIQMSKTGKEAVSKRRQDAINIITGISGRLLVICGPCSIHDPSDALEYAKNLKSLSLEHWQDLCIIMRAYVEKPRTTIGWKGLINDLDLDGRFDIEKGLRVSRQLFCDLTSTGVAIASEMLDTMSPRYLADNISVGVIVARTTKSQLHRELASGLPFPTGFKNGSDGSLSVAIDASCSAANEHHFLNITDEGSVCVTRTSGNAHTFVVLRGGSKGTNFDVVSVREAKQHLTMRGRNQAIMIDCSHGNSMKDYRKQGSVARAVGAQIAAGERAIIGVMIESNLNAGKQSVSERGIANLEKGVSITDGCIYWDETVSIMKDLAANVRMRRKHISQLIKQ